MQHEGSRARPGRRPWTRALVAASIGLASVALIGALILAAILLAVLYDLSPGLRFDSAAWIAATSATDRPRYRMHRDLLRRHSLIGMTRAEVTGLLGPAAQTDTFETWDLVYRMGPEPGPGVDSVWLVLRLAEDRVVKHRVLTD